MDIATANRLLHRRAILARRLLGEIAERGDRLAGLALGDGEAELLAIEQGDAPMLRRRDLLAAAIDRAAPAGRACAEAARQASPTDEENEQIDL